MVTAGEEEGPRAFRKVVWKSRRRRAVWEGLKWVGLEGSEVVVLIAMVVFLSVSCCRKSGVNDCTWRWMQYHLRRILGAGRYLGPRHVAILSTRMIHRAGAFT